MGESRRQRAGLIAQLANLEPQPESVPINHLVQVEGTPLHARFDGEAALDPLEFVRTIAVARITMPRAMVRLSAGRRELGERGAGAVLSRRRQLDLLRRRLLTTGNPDVDRRSRAVRRGSGLRRSSRKRSRLTRSRADTADRRARTRSCAPPRRRACRARGARRIGARSARPESAARTLLAFASNDYLGLANIAVDRRRRSRSRAERWGVGAARRTSSCGHAAPHAALEEELAAFVATLRQRACACIFERAISPISRS